MAESEAGEKSGESKSNVLLLLARGRLTENYLLERCPRSTNWNERYECMLQFPKQHKHVLGNGQTEFQPSSIA